MYLLTVGSIYLLIRKEDIFNEEIFQKLFKNYLSHNATDHLISLKVENPKSSLMKYDCEKCNNFLCTYFCASSLEFIIL